MKANIWNTSIVILAAMITATLAPAQSESDLRETFEGRRVVVLVDMPADEDGIDIEMDKGRSIDRREVNKDLSRYGTAIRQGSVAVITLIKKKGKHIEFQLDGGGWQGGRSAGLNYDTGAEIGTPQGYRSRTETAAESVGWKHFGK